MFFQVTKNTRQLTNVDSWERVTNVGIFSKPWLILLCLGTSDWGCWAAGHFFWQWIQLFKSCQFCRWCYLHGKKETSKRHLQITTFLLTPNQKEGHIFFLFFFGEVYGEMAGLFAISIGIGASLIIFPWHHSGWSASKRHECFTGCDLTPRPVGGLVNMVDREVLSVGGG